MGIVSEMSRMVNDCHRENVHVDPLTPDQRHVCFTICADRFGHPTSEISFRGDSILKAVDDFGDLWGIPQTSLPKLDEFIKFQM